MKNILLILLFITTTLYAEAKFNDPRLLRYPEAKQWSKDADTNGESAYNIGVLYQQTIKDNKKAIEWYKKAYKMDDEGASIDALINLGNIYKKLHQYNDAIFYYKKAYERHSMDAANGLGYLYDVILKDTEQGIKWYEKSASNGNSKAINNLGKTYHELNNNTKASAYILAMVNYGYTKQEVFNFLRNDWKIDQATIKKAYQLQKTLDIPKHYYDKDLEDTPPKKKIGRR
ncbi:MAG: hypothetical protein COB67_10205 [SAR324 cluster bacterium]|uniref:Uncharacterized protein n=1 Tax=SAR324 cluster bacterium TaxID=2024889 RepID=A0A2A4SYF6_9DELT|nr:MAG: hypothetical protein COB67_10205 [SAR324 cluster bacterium]